MELDDLYQEIILDHHRNPRNKGPCPRPDFPDFCSLRATRDNPLCGDEVSVGVLLDGDRITRVAFEGRGCAISQAAASIMTEAVQGRTTNQALELSDLVRRMLRGETDEDDAQQDLGDLVALKGVAKFPMRVKCALLPWMALRDALLQRRGAR